MFETNNRKHMHMIRAAGAMGKRNETSSDPRYFCFFLQDSIPLHQKVIQFKFALLTGEMFPYCHVQSESWGPVDLSFISTFSQIREREAYIILSLRLPLDHSEAWNRYHGTLCPLISVPPT